MFALKVEVSIAVTHRRLVEQATHLRRRDDGFYWHEVSGGRLFINLLDRGLGNTRGLRSADYRRDKTQKAARNEAST